MNGITHNQGIQILSDMAHDTLSVPKLKNVVLNSDEMNVGGRNTSVMKAMLVMAWLSALAARAISTGRDAGVFLRDEVEGQLYLVANAVLVGDTATADGKDHLRREEEVLVCLLQACLRRGVGVPSCLLTHETLVGLEDALD